MGLKRGKARAVRMAWSEGRPAVPDSGYEDPASMLPPCAAPQLFDIELMGSNAYEVIMA